MKKLNKKKIRWIVREGKKRELGFYTIAKLQKITPRWARKVAKKYKDCKDPVILRCGRKPREINKEERDLVIKTYNELRVGATMIEQILREKGVSIGHNRIHKILLEEGLARHEQKKQHRRSWVRYERKHSLSLVHADWFEFKRRQGIIFIDDASRFITAYGEFDNANTENTINVFKKGLHYGVPKQTHTDHGTQFVNNERENAKIKDGSFTQVVKGVGSQHIFARIKHPQANGKAERAIGTIKRLWNELGTLDKAIYLYNYKRPHRSLTNGNLRTPYQAFIDKKRKE